MNARTQWNQSASFFRDQYFCPSEDRNKRTELSWYLIKLGTPSKAFFFARKRSKNDTLNMLFVLRSRRWPWHLVGCWAGTVYPKVADEANPGKEASPTGRAETWWIINEFEKQMKTLKSTTALVGGWCAEKYVQFYLFQLIHLSQLTWHLSTRSALAAHFTNARRRTNCWRVRLANCTISIFLEGTEKSSKRISLAFYCKKK